MQSRYNSLLIRPRTVSAAVGILITALVSLLVLAGCGKAPEATPPQAMVTPGPTKSAELDEQLKAALREAGDGKLKVREAIFLNRLKKQDPAHPIIDRAMITEQNELAVVMNNGVEADKIPDVMKSVMEKMAQEFPEDDLAVVAFAPSDPPRRVGKATRNAKTKETAFTPEG